MKNFIVLILLFGSLLTFGQSHDMYVDNQSGADIQVRGVSVSDCDGAGVEYTSWITILDGDHTTLTAPGLASDF